MGGSDVLTGEIDQWRAGASAGSAVPAAARAREGEEAMGRIRAVAALRGAGVAGGGRADQHPAVPRAEQHREDPRRRGDGSAAPVLRRHQGAVPDHARQTHRRRRRR